MKYVSGNGRKESIDGVTGFFSTTPALKVQGMQFFSD